MARLLRPHIPLKIRCAVARRQIVERIKHGLSSSAVLTMAGQHRSSGKELKVLLSYLARSLGCEVSDLRLDHDPALENRPFNARTKKYMPDANDPEFLIYRTKEDHRIKTLVRGDGAQLSDAAIARKRKRKERKARRPKTLWASRRFKPKEDDVSQKIGPREQQLRDMRATNQLSPGKVVAGRGRRFVGDPTNLEKTVREVTAKLPATSGKKPVKRKAKKR